MKFVRNVSSVVVCLALAGCTTTHFKKSADKEVYSAIAHKAVTVPNMEQEFSIEQKPLPPLEDLEEVEAAADFLGEAGQREVGANILSLEDALAIGVLRSRSYQDQREDVYLQALSLTLDRHQFTPIFAGSISGDYVRSTTDVQKFSQTALAAQAAPDILVGVGNVIGTPADLLSRYADIVEEAAAISGINAPRNEIMDERNVRGNTRIGVGLLLKSGGQIAVDLTSNFLRFLTGDPRVSTTSALAASIRQPLLRGAGSKVAAETLTQAERDLLYSLRDFVRFRQEYTVDVASAYYDVLRSRDQVKNNWRSLLAFEKQTELERALAAEGRSPLSELGRLEQAQLESENAWSNAIRNYRQNLDEFKILIGIPTDSPVILDEHELDELKQTGIIHPEINPEEAAEVALVARLDLYNVYDSVDDAYRKVYVASNALKPDLDLILTADVPNAPDNRFQELDFRRAVWSAGFDFLPPLDRKAERNSYRASLINHERALRQLSLAEDNVKLNVRNLWRNMDQARRTYEIRLKGLEINERRVEEENLRAELGLAIAQDQVDAQNDLTAAQNELTDALVDHTIARLQFWRDMGILFIKENGQWEEVIDVEQP